MRELSLHIVDLVQNAVAAGATKIKLEIVENLSEDTLVICVSDNGRGMDEKQCQRVVDPFVTSRTTRSVGLGLSLIAMSTRQCAGDVVIDSVLGQGTVVKALYRHSHIDRPPLGNMVETLKLLLISFATLDFHYVHRIGTKKICITTLELMDRLGSVLLTQPIVLEWLHGYITENFTTLYGGQKMKSMEELNQLREKMQPYINLRQEGHTQIIVGMGTCGIAAGAREIMSAILDEIANRKIEDVVVKQMGCIGMCEKEVLVDVVRRGEPRITYGNVTTDVITSIISEHVLHGRIVEEYVFSKID